MADLFIYSLINTALCSSDYILSSGMKTASNDLESNPCGGGVEYLHRDPASRKRRRNGAKKGRAIA
jgi:hypothetical protein